MPNAVALERRLGRWVRRARRARRPLAMITVTVIGGDGHGVALDGDEAQRVVEALRCCCQRGELLFRTGEGTFTVIAPKAKRGGVVHRSEAFRACVREAVGPLLGDRIRVCASVSIISRAPRRELRLPNPFTQGVGRPQIA